MPKSLPRKAVGEIQKGNARTTNAVEGWQLHVITQRWTFLHGLKKVMQQKKAVFLQATAGVVHQASRKFRMLNERVVRAVAGQSGILVYLYIKLNIKDKNVLFRCLKFNPDFILFATEHVQLMRIN